MINKESYFFSHPLKENSNTFNISENIKNDLDLTSNQNETKLKLYDVILNNIETIQTCSGVVEEKTKSQQRVYDEITNTMFVDKNDIITNQELINIVGVSLDETLLEKTLQQQEIIEKTILEKEINSNFYDTYNYIDYKPIDFVNRSSKIMGFLNLYTLSTPLLTLLMPLMVLLIPFFTMKVRGVSISFSSYFSFLKQILSRVPAFRIFTFTTKDSIGTIVSAFMGFILYFVQVYYNTKYCSSYVEKNHDIHNSILIIQNVINNSSSIFNKIIDKVIYEDNSKMNGFLNNLVEKRAELEILKTKFENYKKEYSVLTFEHANTIGNKLKIYYELVSDYKNIKDKLRSIFDFNTFFAYYKNIHTNIQRGYISFCNMTHKSIVDNERTTEKENKKNNSIVEFKKMYFPMLLIEENNIIYNDLTIDKSFIISGPNASGKTTLLKSVLFNICCTQQFGCGFYKEGILNESFSMVDSYINILDTHDRNSLFQNEALRMLEIMKKIDNNGGNDKKKENMFFVFDELFSGTNPKEATACGISSLLYILKYKNIKFMLTTHYEDVCRYFSRKSYSNVISNKKMKCNYLETMETINYDYKLKNGISNIYGGLNVLKELQYSSSIIKNAEKLLSN